MGKKTLMGKVQMSGEDYTYLSNLAKECLVNRRTISILESSIQAYKDRLAEVKTELAELKAKCKPFLEALALAPKKVMEFIEKIIKPKYKPVEPKAEPVKLKSSNWDFMVDDKSVPKAPERKQKPKNKGGWER